MTTDFHSTTLQEYLVEMEQEMWALGDPDIAPSRNQRSLAVSGGKKLSAAEEAREKVTSRVALSVGIVRDGY